MKRFLSGILGVCWALVLTSCSKSNNEPTEFDIIGQWGVVSITYTQPGMDASYFGPMENKYYSYWTFQINGAMSVKSDLTGNMEYGDYVYNANKKTLRYIYGGYKSYVDANVAVMSPTEMAITANFGSIGNTLYRMKKVAW